MPRRRRAALSVTTPEPPDRPGSARLPRIVFYLLCALVLALGILEVRHRLEGPLLRRLTNDRRAAQPLVLYQTGNGRARVAWLLSEGADGGGNPKVIQRIPCDGSDYQTGDLHWTADGRAVYAIHRERRGADGGPVPLWCFEFESGRLFITDPVFAPPETLSILEPVAGMTQRLWEHGGPGARAAEWRRFGAQGTPLWLWETARWEMALPKERGK